MADDSSNTLSSNTQSYEPAFKLQVVEYAEKNTNRGAAREFELEEKLVREWRNHKDDLTKSVEIDQALDSTPVKSVPEDVPRTPKRQSVPKKQYTPAFKLEVIQKAEEQSNRAVAKEYDLDEKMVREWRKRKDTLQALPPERKKMGNSGLRPLLPELEKTLVEWIAQQPIRPTNVKIQEKALELNYGQVEFKASRGWLDKFLHRHNLHIHTLKSQIDEVVTMDVDSVISQIVPGEGEAISVQACLDVNVANVEETGTKRRRFEPAFKLKAIEYAEKTSNRYTARVFNVDERMIRSWKAQKAHLQSLPQETSIPMSPVKPIEVAPGVTLETNPDPMDLQTVQEVHVVSVDGEPSTPSQTPAKESSQVQTPVQGRDTTQLIPVKTGDASVPQEFPLPIGLPITPNKKRKYETAFKLQVVEYAEKVSNRGAGRHFGVDEKRVREWRKQKDLLQKLPPGKHKVGVSGCHPMVPELEKDLAAWIRDSPVKPTHTKIQAKARELYTGEKPFKASRGWLEKFLKRSRLRSDPENVEERIEKHEEEIPVVPQVTEVSMAPDPIQINPEELNEVDIQACLNLAKTIEDGVKHGGDESVLLLAKSIEESVKKTIAETLAKANAGQTDETSQAAQVSSIEESLVKSIEEGLAKSVQEIVGKTVEEAS